MPFAQKNYLAIQGINGKYRIDQIGCYLTSFSNLLERFSSVVSPVDLNAIFRDRGIYIDVDDGIKDDLGWQSITAYDGKIVVSRINNAGGNWPTSDNSIVRFKYKGKSGFTTHFCLVVDAANHKIIDSYDGVTKDGQTKYGTPTGWAEYVENKPQPVTPPAPVVPAPDPEIITITVQPGWGITHVLKAAGYTKAQWDNEAEWDRVAALNGHATRMKLSVGQPVKVNRTPLALPVAPAPIEPVAIPVVTDPIPPVSPDPTPVIAPVIPHNPDFKPDDYLEDESTRRRYVLKDEYNRLVIKDISGINTDTVLEQGRPLPGWAEFWVGGIRYIRTKKSVDNGWWYGVPLSALEPLPDSFADEEVGNIADELKAAMEEIHDEAKKNAHSFGENILNIIGAILNLFSRNKNKKSKE